MRIWKSGVIVVVALTLLGLAGAAGGRSESADTPALNLEMIGHSGGEVQAVAVVGNLAYVGMGNELAVLNISNPAQPQRVGYVAFEVDYWQTSITNY